jgi:hypothetical protein
MPADWQARSGPEEGQGGDWGLIAGSGGGYACDFMERRRDAHGVGRMSNDGVPLFGAER